jgi:LytS/YehU family sensor histidine kinase
MIPEYFMSEGRNYLYSEEFRDEMSRPKPFRNHFFHEFTQHLLQFLLVLIFSLMLRISLRWKQAEKEKLSVELSYLKAQINPHFLFNTLNSIYSLAIEKSDYAPTAIVKLSEMMRYVTTEADKNFVSLEKELRYISSYIELQKIRFGETIRFSFSQSGKIKDQKIAPLILISFVENAFKHGVNPEEDSEIDVNISVTEDTLHLIVYNKKVTVRLQEEVRTEMGIGNTRNRLQMLYPLKHELVITDAKDSYSVSLTINLK